MVSRTAETPLRHVGGRSVVAAVAGVVLASVLGAAAPAGTAGTIPRLGTPATVKIGVTASPLTLAGFYVATARGYFKEAGITNEAVAIPGINELLFALTTGDVDIGTGGPSTALFNAVGRGIRLRIVADQHTAFPGRSAIALMVRKDLIDSGQVKSLGDLKGRTISLNARRATIELAFEKALRAVGLASGDVKFVVMGFPQVNAAFGSRTIDAGFQVEPLVAAAVAGQLAVRWRGLDDLQPNLQNVFLVASERFAGRTDVARAWIVAYLRGVRDYNDAMFKRRDRDAVVKILTQHTLVKDAATYDRMVMPGIHPDGELNVPSIRESYAQLRATGEVTGDVDLDRIIDQSFVRYAQQVLGPYAP